MSARFKSDTAGSRGQAVRAPSATVHGKVVELSLLNSMTRAEGPSFPTALLHSSAGIGVNRRDAESYFWIGVSALTLRVTPFLVFFAVLAETFVQANVRFVSDRK